MSALAGPYWMDIVTLILDTCLQAVVHHAKVSFYLVLHWANFDSLGQLVADLVSCTILPAGPCLRVVEGDGTVVDRELSDALIHDVRVRGSRIIPAPTGPRRFQN